MSTVERDRQLRLELVGYADEANLPLLFQERYGRGWQRKLAKVLDVPETTVNGWFKSQKLPTLAKLAFGILLSDKFRSPQQWIAVKGKNGYSVCSIEGRIGRVVVENIEDMNDALLMAGSPALRDAAGHASWLIEESFPEEDSPFKDLVDDLKRALDVARPLPEEAGEEDEDTK